jgi:hypothetical protein
MIRQQILAPTLVCIKACFKVYLELGFVLRRALSSNSRVPQQLGCKRRDSRQHTPTHLHTCARASCRAATCIAICQHTSAYVSIRQHTSAYVIIRQHTSAYGSIRQHTSAYVSIRQHTSAYFSIRQHTSAHASGRAASCNVFSFSRPQV